MVHLRGHSRLIVLCIEGTKFNERPDHSVLMEFGVEPDDGAQKTRGQVSVPYSQ
jgi:hypothetical protein